jgi:hypothetical protein
MISLLWISVGFSVQLHVRTLQQFVIYPSCSSCIQLAKTDHSSLFCCEFQWLDHLHGRTVHKSQTFGEDTGGLEFWWSVLVRVARSPYIIGSGHAGCAVTLGVRSNLS